MTAGMRLTTVMTRRPMRGSVTSLESQCILTGDRKKTSIKGLVLCITIGQWMDTIHSRGQNMIKKRYSITQTTTNTLLHIDYIAQSFPKAWTTFILDKSDGFTRPGVERINDSVRTYCWAILGSQSQITSDILGVGSAFDAQKQFLANTEDAIQSPVDLPSQITRYQNALKYARTKVDYVFGFGLYMAPNNMELRIGTIQCYNNKIILSTHDQKLW